MLLVTYDFKSIPSLDCERRIGTEKRTNPSKGQVKLNALFILNLSEYCSVFVFLSRPVYTLKWVSFYSRFKNNDYRVVWSARRRAKGTLRSFCMERGETINLRWGAPEVSASISLKRGDTELTCEAALLLNLGMLHSHQVPVDNDVLARLRQCRFYGLTNKLFIWETRIHKQTRNYLHILYEVHNKMFRLFWYEQWN